MVDFPHANEVVTGRELFYGWALSEDTVKAVDIYVDRGFWAHARIGVHRPDVNKAFPGFASSDNAGWNLDVNALTLPAGAHQLIFEAKTDKGAVGCIGERSVTVIH